MDTKIDLIEKQMTSWNRISPDLYDKIVWLLDLLEQVDFKFTVDTYGKVHIENNHSIGLYSILFEDEDLKNEYF